MIVPLRVLTVESPDYHRREHLLFGPKWNDQGLRTEGSLVVSCRSTVVGAGWCVPTLGRAHPPTKTRAKQRCAAVPPRTGKADLRQRHNSYMELRRTVAADHTGWQ